jgi:hypothetical protein
MWRELRVYRVPDGLTLFVKLCTEEYQRKGLTFKIFYGHQSLWFHLETHGFTATQHIDTSLSHSAQSCIDVLDQAVDHAAAI